MNISIHPLLRVLLSLIPLLASPRILYSILLALTTLTFLAALGFVPLPALAAPALAAAAYTAPQLLVYALAAAAAAIAILAAFTLVVLLKMTRPPRKKSYEWTPGQLGLPYEEFTVESSDGVELHGWLIRGGDKGPVVAAHGYTSNMGAAYMRKAVEGLARRGYTVATFDFRGHGSSGGSYTTVGPRESDDLEAVIDWLLARTGARGVALIGYSMGAMTSIITAARDERVRAVVADSPPPGLPQAMRRGLTYFAHLPGWLASLLTPFLEAWARIIYRVNPREYVMWDLAARGRAHILVVVGTEDPLVTVEEAERIAGAARRAGRDGEVYVVEGVGHVETVRDPRYLDVVEGFIAGHMEE